MTDGNVGYGALSRESGFSSYEQQNGGSSKTETPEDDSNAPTSDVASLMELGFDRDRCEIALASADGNVSQAAQLLFGEQINENIPSEPERHETKIVENSGASTVPDENTFVPFSIDEQDVRMNGFLERKSKVLKQWRKRFFVLKGVTMSTYLKKPQSLSDLDDDDAKDRLEITIDSSVKESAKSDTIFILSVDEEDDKGKAKKPIEVYFQAEDTATKQRWILALRKCIDDVQRVADEKEAREMQEKVTQLTQLGYSAAAAEAALGAAAGDIGAAVDFLLSEGGGGNTGESNFDGYSGASGTNDNTCRVKIPEGAKPGDNVIVTADNGQKYRITVPTGKKGGDYVPMAY